LGASLMRRDRRGWMRVGGSVRLSDVALGKSARRRAGAYGGRTAGQDQEDARHASSTAGRFPAIAHREDRGREGVVRFVSSHLFSQTDGARGRTGLKATSLAAVAGLA